MKLASWFGRPARRDPAPAQRWVVIDAETSGLDSSRDRLLSIAGVALVGSEVLVEDSFETFILQATPSSHDNIVIHGISGSAQMAGQPEAQVLRDFEAWRKGAPVLGWHVGFDMGFLRPAYARCGLASLPKDVADLAPLVQAVFKDRNSDLDHWLARFDIAVEARHSAAADAWMTALLAARVVSAARREGIDDFRALRKLAANQRWAG